MRLPVPALRRLRSLVEEAVKGAPAQQWSRDGTFSGLRPLYLTLAEEAAERIPACLDSADNASALKWARRAAEHEAKHCPEVGVFGKLCAEVEKALEALETREEPPPVVTLPPPEQPRRGPGRPRKDAPQVQAPHEATEPALNPRAAAWREKVPQALSQFFTAVSVDHGEDKLEVAALRVRGEGLKDKAVGWVEERLPGLMAEGKTAEVIHHQKALSVLHHGEDWRQRWQKRLEPERERAPEALPGAEVAPGEPETSPSPAARRSPGPRPVLRWGQERSASPALPMPQADPSPFRSRIGTSLAIAAEELTAALEVDEREAKELEERLEGLRQGIEDRRAELKTLSALVAKYAPKEGAL